MPKLAKNADFQFFRPSFERFATIPSHMISARAICLNRFLKFRFWKQSASWAKTEPRRTFVSIFYF